MVNKRTQQTRDKILQAASAVTLENGIGNLTLEAVAKRAGISKGGLLYHYKNKDSLVQGMIEYSITHFNERLEKKLEQETNWARSYIETSFESDPIEDQMSASLLAAVVLNPELLEPLRHHYRLWQDTLAAEVGLPKSLLIRLTIDGLWVTNLLGFAVPTHDEVQVLKQQLIDLLEETS